MTQSSGANAIPLDRDVNRIANGVIAAENQFPYAVSLQENTPAAQQTATRGHRCGGALVTLGHVLTTASCLFETVNGVSVQINPTQHRVFAGSSFLTNDTVADRVRGIANFSIHPSYTGEPAFVNDIAIIILAARFLAATVTPLALPPANFNPPDFTLCQVAGWGATTPVTTASTELRFANKYVYNQNLCTSLYNSQPGIPNIMPTMICAASYDILSSGCVNDNGNALVCDGTLTGVLFVTDNCRSSSFPELYTRVSNYTTWIQSVSASPSLFTPGVLVMTVLVSVTQLFVNKY
ncbi:trypsin delta-like [Epargyreus clarus]|uniref:trypsin delta-like n=1 Tax=Epargyreus clarus TaxID=520877 RepID=UPI003C2B1982